MAVEDRTGGVGDRLVHVVALDQHGVEAGDAPPVRRARPLEQLGQQREDRRRVAAGDRRFAGGESDLPLGHGEAGEAVHHEDDVGPLIAEPLGDAGGGEGGPDAHEGRLVGRGHDDHRAGQALGSEIVVDELVDLAATLTDQRQDDDGCVGAPGDHGEQARLAHARAGEDPHALAAPARRHGVDGPHAEGELAVDHLSAQRMRCGALDRDGVGVGEGGSVIDGPAQAVEDATEQAGADLDPHRLEGGLDGRAEVDALEVAEGHAGQAVALDGDHLGVEHAAVAPDAHGVADGRFDALDLEPEPDQAADPAGAPGGAGPTGGAERRVLPAGH